MRNINSRSSIKAYLSNERKDIGNAHCSVVTIKDARFSFGKHVLKLNCAIPMLRTQYLTFFTGFRKHISLDKIKAEFESREETLAFISERKVLKTMNFDHETESMDLTQFPAVSSSDAIVSTTTIGRTLFKFANRLEAQ